MVIKAKTIVKNPLQFQNSASAVPRTYNKLQITAKATFVAMDNVPIMDKNCADPKECSIFMPRLGYVMKMMMTVSILLPTSGERISLYTSKLNTEKYGLFPRYTSASKKKEKK